MSAGEGGEGGVEVTGRGVMGGSQGSTISSTSDEILATTASDVLGPL